MGINAGDVSRAPNGISTDDITQNMGFYGLPDPTKYHSYFEDFDYYNEAVDWIGVDVGASVRNLSSQDDGILLDVAGINIGDSSSIQKVGSNFQLELGKKFFGKVRFKVESANLAIFHIGLCVQDIISPATVTDGIYFDNVSGTNDLSLISVKGSTQTVLNIGSLVDDEYIELGFYFDGDNRILAFVNNSAVGSINADNLPDSVVLTPSVYLENNEAAVVKRMHLDYLFFAKER